MRKRTCKVCKTKYLPERPGQSVCSIPCSLVKGREDQRKARERKHRADKKALREKDKSWHLKKTQEAFNKYIRTRDFSLPCVSCGRHHSGQYHAGHYRPVGGRSGGALRFEPDNCHKQCSVCNNHHSGLLTDYRLELIRRIGQDRVDWLEGPHDKKTWQIEELKALREKYQEMTKELLVTPGAAEPF